MDGRDKVVWKDTGLSPLRVLVHKSRGVMEVCFSLSHLYPRIVTGVAVLFVVGTMVVGGFAVFRSQPARLSLKGSELEAANSAYASIRSAQEVAEFFPGSIHRQAALKAERDLELMKGRMRSKKGLAASRIFTYYLLAVEALPLDDYECADAKLVCAQCGERIRGRPAAEGRSCRG